MSVVVTPHAMPVFETVKAFRHCISQWKRQGLTVAFVPTMGNLHAGHLSLVSLAKQQADKVVVSIFVNPLQFGEGEDFATYPKTFIADVEQLNTFKVDALFFPSAIEMYPNQASQTTVCVDASLTGLLEGASRPGHFDGVTTVVAKLFNMVQPDVAVFGQKDYQQLAVVKKMVLDLAMPINIVPGKIGRDLDGLALSSRNQYLTAEQRHIAPNLYRVLQRIKRDVKSISVDGLTVSGDIAMLEEQGASELLALGFDSVDYLHIRCATTLLPLNAQTGIKEWQKQPGLVVILAVARLGKTRLLDNIVL